ncbi:MAG: HPr family phosphocarrier protein [Bifidobacteriaceae bacterium]|jgi:phosphocarrier protein|nr:HPr family phosphocarrier protein [Bifidobacteriaceae bacterium]
MISFDYTIQDDLGIHARPAGVIVREVQNSQSKVEVHKADASAEANKIFAIMKLGVKQGDTITVTVDGPDEAELAAKLKTIFEQQL